jgi:hypothetical protein
MNQVNSSLEDLLQKADKCIKLFAKCDGRKQTLERFLNGLNTEVANCKTLDLSYQRLQKFFQHMGTTEQENLQRWFEQVITYGMRSVFGDAYRFVIIGPEIKANEIAIDFKIMKRSGDTELERDPYDEMGGGVADVLSFLLQFIMVFLLRDRINPILFLDEACKHLSMEHRPAMANLLQELVEKTGVQILMISHDPVFLEAADVAYEFSHNGVETVVSKLK